MRRVSVVVPVYNISAYVERCVESILAQTYNDFELLLVNDGSTDDSLEKLERFAKQDSRIQVINKVNGGLSDARNAGLKVASGEYIQFIDGDDFIEPTLLEDCITKLDETDADMVIFDFYQYYLETGEKEKIASPFLETKEYTLQTNPELLISIPNAAWNKMYRRSLFVDHQIEYPKGYYYEDLGTTYRLIARAKKVVFLNKALYDYLQDRPGNITHQFNNRIYHVLDMVKLNLDDYKQQGLYDIYYEELKLLSGVNILECLKKTRDVVDTELVDQFVDACFDFLKSNWPEFPKCKYKITREKWDWIYAHKSYLKWYLKYRQNKQKG